MSSLSYSNTTQRARPNSASCTLPVDRSCARAITRINRLTTPASRDRFRSPVARSTGTMGTHGCRIYQNVKQQRVDLAELALKAAEYASIGQFADAQRLCHDALAVAPGHPGVS